MRKKIFNLFFLLFGFNSQVRDGSKKGIIIILIDGLSFDALTHAIKKEYCPTLKKLSSKYTVHQYYCGLPAATTATEALLFYGNNFNIPGFTWYDRSLKQFVRGNRSLELTLFEDTFQKKRSLLKGGSAIMSVYSGGATELSISGRNLTFFRSFYLMRSAHYFLMALLYPVQLARAIYLTLKTLILYRKSNRQSVEETFSKMVLGQFSCFLTEIEIMRNTKKIFVDFLLYDEFAHEYGPTHSTTLSTLRLVDRYIKRILNTTKKADRTYELILLSDHGQTESIPFDHPINQSTIDISKALENPSYTVIKTYGGFIPSGESKKDVYVVPAGSTLQLYFSNRLDSALYESEINMQFPKFISNLLTFEEFGWVLGRQKNDTAIVYGKNGSIAFHKDKPYVMVGSPFPELEKEELKKLMMSFQYYSAFPNNGDLVLFGNITKQKKVYSFEKHKGTHGGFYGPMTHPFIISSDPKVKGDSMESLFDTIALSI